MSFSAVSANERAWLILLLLVWAALLFGGFAFGRTRSDRQRRMPAWTRMASSFVLVLAGWSWFVFSRGRGQPLPLCLATGMTLGFVGDLFMARWLPSPNRVLAGMASFALGHAAYITGVLLFAAERDYTRVGAFWGAWLFWLLIGLAGWYLVVFRGHRPSILHWAALPYALLLASTAGFASGLALLMPAALGLVLGAALFLASDLLLAAGLFNHLHFYLSDDLVWLLYGPGQALIVYSAGSVLSNI